MTQLFPTKRSSNWWLPYVVIAILGYVFGSVSPSQIVSQMTRRSLSDEVVEEEEEEEEKEEGFDLTSDEDVTIVTCIVLVLIALTIMFEFIKEHLEERATRNLRPLVDKLFGEMTVLGFLSVVTFAVTKAGWFSALSKIFFGDKEELLEIFEFVHFTIFFIMIAFVVQVLILVAAAMETERSWIEMDKAARNPSLGEEWERRAESYYSADKAKRRQSFKEAREVTSLLPILGDRTAQKSEDLILYKALRDEFMMERSSHSPFHPAPLDTRVSSDFNFGRYLGINQGTLLAHVVEVSIVTWSFFAILTLIYYAYVIAVNENVEVLAWSWVAMGWIVYTCNIFFERHLVYVRRFFLKKELFLKAKMNSRAEKRVSLMPDADETTYLNSLVDAEESGNIEQHEVEESLPMWTEIDIDDYHVKRSWLKRRLVGGHPSRQQAIYWFDRRGPRVYLLILQSNILFLGIYAAMNFLGFFQYMYNEEQPLAFAIYAILALLPLFGIMFGKQHMVAILTQISCMGAYRRPNVVADVLREEKTARVVRAFIVIYKMRRFATCADQSNYDRESAADTVAVTRKNFDKIELREVEKTFDAFDRSGDGAISHDEFESLMKGLGAEITDEGLNHMISMLDADGDGEVTKEEFINWYAESAGEDDLSESERAHFLFRLFDKDNSGEISIGEFKHKLDALNVGFTVDEVGAIVNELDEDNSGSIGEHEFAMLLHKYYPKELQNPEAIGRQSSMTMGGLFNPEPSIHAHHHDDWANSTVSHH
mmetsp:Transcript_661/g.1112  ORF Transcript_661/g.1112 Transcript_661/m.1112 type:complete len:765 (-) Transcript_661:50-2344(-)|eukprot:CAMPEP_0119005012 /NCGR_PEP_ID=MMETSP1176-20130426/1477_1 /TAXON_ID=265551 /ORGANISM="Synedropsis recta cf, Strain CCMP1620" /LENGTH=764 /DNA_ID=CAMNT_0006956775 /DNA_START=73 /DNA_END=2367 /DNA_ORIENTATION=-